MTDDERARAARRGLAVYFAVVIPVSALVEWAIARSGGTVGEKPLYVVALMWTPALGMVIARLVGREGFRDVSFRLRSSLREGRPALRRALLCAWLYPVVVGLVAYGAAWATGLEHFSPKSMATFGLGGAPAAVRLVASLALNLTLGTALSAITATGEELGWRGYMLVRMVDARVPRPVLVGSVVWGLWHLPLIVAGLYAAGPYPLLSAAGFFVTILGGGMLVGYTRLASGSVWPAVLFHATWNAVIQGTFDGFTAGGDAARTTNVLTGESGIFVALASILVTYALVCGTHRVFRTPDEPISEAPAAIR